MAMSSQMGGTSNGSLWQLSPKALLLETLGAFFLQKTPARAIKIITSHLYHWLAKLKQGLESVSVIVQSNILVLHTRKMWPSSPRDPPRVMLLAWRCYFWRDGCKGWVRPKVMGSVPVMIWIWFIGLSPAKYMLKYWNLIPNVLVLRGSGAFKRWFGLYEGLMPFRGTRFITKRAGNYKTRLFLCFNSFACTHLSFHFLPWWEAAQNCQ
jgi:hypothetical protein